MTTVQERVTELRAERPTRRRVVSPYLVTALIAPVIYGVWHYVTNNDLVPSILLPTPQAVADAVPRVVGANGFAGHVMRTVSEIVLGFGLGGFVGFALGLLLGSSLRLRTAYLPFLSALEAIPTVILAPVIIAWFGFGIEGKVFQAAIACFYAVFITTLSGLGLAEPNSVQLMRSLCASKWQIMRMLKIPAALPVIFGGLQLGATTAIIGAIVSEFVGSDAGLGYLLQRYRSGFDTPAAWVIIGIFLIFGLVAYLILWLAERKIVFWRAAAVTRPDLEKQ
jgi:ABC-type nitrate/sulfonate/bicarbonate transport system permease component